MKKLFLALAVMAVAYAQLYSVALYPSDSNPPEVSPNISRIQPVETPDLVSNVATQAQLSGNTILWLNNMPQAAHDSTEAYDSLERTLQEALKYPGKFTHVYIYDELYWTPTGYVPNHNRAEVERVADLAHQYGFKTIITIMPFVLSQKDFALDMSKFDVIAFDLYPFIPMSTDWGDCYYSDNYEETQVFCTVQRIRELGFTGYIGYIYQAFSLSYIDNKTLEAALVRQRVAVCNAEALGVSFVMAFGLYLGTGELEREPWLVPLGGTEYERLVIPCLTQSTANSLKVSWKMANY